MGKSYLTVPILARTAIKLLVSKCSKRRENQHEKGQ